MINKREILQPMLDRMEPGWVIVKPDPLNPDNFEEACKFQKDYREALVNIPN